MAVLSRRAAIAALGAPILAGCAGGVAPAGTTVTASPRPEGRLTDGAPLVVATVATGLEVPWGLAFLPDDSAVVTERDSRRVLHVEPFSTSWRLRELGVVAAATPEGEGGLLGVAASPTYAADGLLFFYLTTAADNRIVRGRLDRGRLGGLEVLLDGIPRGAIHDGGRLAFGPDGFLYASTGETGDPGLAQDRTSLAGKILRLTMDGRPAPGNPEDGSPVWSWGHRNVQGLAFDDDGRLWASEFGQNQWDELNLIRPGANYGWPMVEGPGGEDGLVDPQVVWATDEASPSGLAWLDGQLWLGALRGQRLWRVDVSSGVAARPTDFFVGEYGRVRTVVATPGGGLWVTTSNRDGRGDPGAEDDRILAVVPARAGHVTGRFDDHVPGDSPQRG